MAERARILPDLIHIEGLELRAYLGVPAQERARAQRLTINVTMELQRGWPQADRIEDTVDYAAVAQRLQILALEKPRQLLEMLATDLAAHLLEAFALSAVEIELRKYILPETSYVAVRIRREGLATAPG